MTLLQSQQILAWVSQLGAVHPMADSGVNQRNRKSGSGSPTSYPTCSSTCRTSYENTIFATTMPISDYIIFGKISPSVKQI